MSAPKLYRGQYYGVFTGANGYYLARMADDGLSHYQPANQGNGWSDAQARRLNASAAEAEAEAEAERGSK